MGHGAAKHKRPGVEQYGAAFGRWSDHHLAGEIRWVSIFGDQSVCLKKKNMRQKHIGWLKIHHVP